MRLVWKGRGLYGPQLHLRALAAEPPIEEAAGRRRPGTALSDEPLTACARAPSKEPWPKLREREVYRDYIVSLLKGYLVVYMEF